MTPEQRRVDGLEKAVEEMRKELVDQGKTLVAQVTLLKIVSERIETAGTERGNIAKELGAYGIALTKFVASTDAMNTMLIKLESLPGRVANLEQDVAQIAPKVDAQEGRYQQAIGVGKFAKLLYVIVGAIATGLVWLASHLPQIQLPRK